MYLIPIAAIVCIGLLLSSVTRNSAAAVVGTLMVSLLFQLVGILPGLSGLQPYLLSTQFNAWQGLLRDPDRLGADRPCRLGVRDVRRAGARRRVPRLPAPRRRRWLSVGRGERVLVVDDDPPLRRMLERTLVAEGFEVTVAADGGAALVAAERTRPT